MADVIEAEVTLDYKDIEKLLKKFSSEMPGIATKLMRAVNAEAKKQLKRAFKERGYKPHVERSYGDAGYIKNLASFANKDFSASIIMRKDAFHYKFLEFGTTHEEMWVKRNGTRYKVKGFSVPARPILYPVADSIWKTKRAEEIMEKKFQQELDKLNRGNK